MNFFTVNIGDIAVILAIVGGIYRFDSLIRKLMYEHNMLMQDYCERKNIKLHELPTRMKS